jgi:integral membrane protein
MTQPAPTPAPAGVTADAATARLKRYRVMAWVTGTMLLVLCLEMVLKYVFHAGGYDAEGHAAPVIGTWVAIAHGWVYVVYLATVVQLWSAMRWSLGRLATMALAGVVPVMSFVLERRVHAQAVARITAG